MAEKYLQVIQNGISSYVPDNRFNRSFWAKQNAKVSRNRNAQQEVVTIREASPEEVEFMQSSGFLSNVAPTNRSNEIDELKATVALQTAQIAALLEKGKPGPKPKND